MGQSNSRLFHYITQEAVAIRVNKEKLNSGDSLIPESNKTFKNSFFTDANRVKYKKNEIAKLFEYYYCHLFNGTKKRTSCKAEMWFYRRMMRILRTELVINGKVLEKK